MKTRAAVMRTLGGPLSVEDIELDPPREGEVLLRMVAAGICGSDRHILHGSMPSPVPAVAGHEGSGIVEAVGPGVTRVAVGDHVIQTFIAPCGQCESCRRGQRMFCLTGRPGDGRYADGTFRMHAADGSDIATTLRLGTFSAHTVTTQDNCVVVPKDIDLVPAALVSCGVSTGAGAAVNVADIRWGDTVSVVGIGGVGAAAVVGASIAGAARIIAVDVHDSKRDLAMELGATDYIDARTTTLSEAVEVLVGSRGIDKVLLTLDVIHGPQIAEAVRCLAAQGVVVLVGAADPSLDHIPVRPGELMMRQRSITATVYGGVDVERDALRWFALYRSGRLPLDRFITKRYPLDGINEAFADLAAGRNVRGVIVFDQNGEMS